LIVLEKQSICLALRVRRVRRLSGSSVVSGVPYHNVTFQNLNSASGQAASARWRGLWRAWGKDRRWGWKVLEDGDTPHPLPRRRGA
jgi:hypothetical protein